MLRTLLVFVVLVIVGLGSAYAQDAAGPHSSSAVLTPAADRTTEAGLSAAERVRGLSTFWKEVHYNFVYFDQVPDVDWDSTFTAFVPKVLAARDTFTYYRTLQRFCAVLNDGHTNVYFPDDLDLSRHVDVPAVRLRSVNRRAIVADVDAGLAAELPLGSEVLTVDGLSVEAKLRRDVFPYLATSAEHVRWHFGIRGWSSQALGLLAGPPGTTARLTVRTPSGEERTVDVPRTRLDQEVDWVKPPTPRAPRFERRELDDDVAYVALNTFGADSLVADFRAALPKLVEAKGLVIDLRSNGGGNGSIAKGVARHLLADSALGSAWRTREHVAAYKAWGRFGEEGDRFWPYGNVRAWRTSAPDTLAPASPDEGRLLVPTVVLTSWQTASAAEDFLIYLDAQPHVTLVGEPTFGSTGQPLFFDLPSGGRARVVTKRDTYPDGRDFVGFGIEPDVTVQPTVDDVRSGRDATLARGLNVLRQHLDEN